MNTIFHLFVACPHCQDFILKSLITKTSEVTTHCQSYDTLTISRKPLGNRLLTLTYCWWLQLVFCSMSIVFRNSKLTLKSKAVEVTNDRSKLAYDAQAEGNHIHHAFCGPCPSFFTEIWILIGACAKLHFTTQILQAN